ncbi:HEAT repeat-containing protein 1-like isoform X2 [Littorina saxatilis]|uniref:HEAT repeat-containing protein 1-like isoform X2 n=1 Tax=Littorina saxatilis TaxID=31220 RepID=UPI0038B67DA9
MTSLAQQLKQLAIPQTQALLGDDTRKASFLYDPQKAASIDRETFFCIGTNGLEELCALDEGFEEYEPVLFSESSLTFERSIQTREVIEKLDQNIEAFLMRLSPFLQLSSTHKALEWLVQRYRIHLNNVDSLVQCFLPYHETDLFPRMLQLIDLMAHKNHKWAWLLPLQKNGVHLTRQTLVNQCRTNPAFLAIITDLVPAFVRVFDVDSKNRAERLRVVMNFYALTLIAVVDSGPVTERILSAILPVLSRGLKSDVLDYKAASYGILGKVLQKSTLKTSLVETLMNAVCKNLTSQLAKEGLCIVLLMFQTQDISKLPKKSFKYISRLPTLSSLLATLSATFQSCGLVSAILRRLIPAAVKQTALDVISSSSSSYSSEDESESSRVFLMSLVHSIMTGVTMDTETITLAARLLLENFVQHCGNDAVDQKEAVMQVKKVVRVFETRYPESLDSAVDSVMSSAENEKDKQVIKQFLNLSVSSVHHRLAPNSHATLALCLHHPHSSVRVNAVTYLMDNLNTMDDKESVKETFLARLQDESSAVIQVLLKDPQKLHSVFEKEEELITALLVKLKSIDTSVKKLELASQLLKVLTQGTVTPSIEAVVLSHLLCSPRSQVLHLVGDLLSSPAAADSPLLSYLMRAWHPKVLKLLKKGEDKITEADVSSLNTALIDTLASSMASLDPHTTIEKLEQEMGAVSVMRQKCLAYLLCEVSVRVTDKTKDQGVSSKLKLQFTRMMKDFAFEKNLFTFCQPKSSSNKANSLDMMSQLYKGRGLPATWWMGLLARWIASLVVPAPLKEMEFWHDVELGSVTGMLLQAVVMVTDLLLQLVSNERMVDKAKTQLTKLEEVFASPELYLRYLCVLWSSESTSHLGVTPALRDHALQLTRTHLTAMGKEDVTAVVQSPAPVLPCLLVMCGSESDSVRRWALKMMSILTEKCSNTTALYKPVLDLVTHYRQEITSDAAYLVTALSGLKSKSGKRKGKQSEALSALLTVIESSSTPCFVSSALLQALSSIDTMDTLTPLLPLLARLLEKDSMTQCQMEVMHHLLTRFTAVVAPEMTPDSLPLQLLTAAAKNNVKVEDVPSTQEMAISQIKKEFFAALPSLESQRIVAESLLDVLQATTHTNIATLIRKIFKHASLPADLLSVELAPILESAASSVREVKRMRRQDAEEKSTFDSPAWVRATVLLEIMQTKKKIPDGCKLVPVCFQILAKVLEVENAGEAEYLKQLILGVIHNLCHKHSPDSEPIQGKHLNLEAIVQCIRTSHNPHTHQQALLVLSVAAQIAPEQLLHSMMSVFTFMGANILRQDDSYSFQVITRILETVFPALVMACSKDKSHSVTDMVTMILRVFVDAYPHIPEHRKLMVFSTLLKVIGVEDYLWRLLLVFVEGVAVRSKTAATAAVTEAAESAIDQEGKSKAIDQVHMDFLITLVLEFSPLACLQMAQKAIQYLAQLPDEKSDSKPKAQRQSRSALDASKEECEIFSLARHNTKQLHKFKHATVLTLWQLLSNRNFIAVISNKLGEETMGSFSELLETLLSYIGQVSLAVEHFAGSPHVEYWKGLLNKCNNLLDSLVSLLPQDKFLGAVSSLLDSPVLTVQRKAMELLASRLKHLKDTGSKQQMSVLLGMVNKLQKSVQQLQQQNSTHCEEVANNGKMALYTLMLLCRVLGAQHHVTFLQVLQQVCEVMRAEGMSNDIIATALLCASEIMGCVRAHAIVHLPRIMPVILQQLQVTDTMENDMLSSCVMSLHKVMDALPHFLSPYLQDILTQVCHLQTVMIEAPASEQRDPVLRSLKHTSKSMAALTPRLFLPTVSACYTALLETERQESVTSLLNVLGQHVSGMSREDLNANHHQLLAFFLTALDFRVTQRKEVSSTTIDQIEGAVIDTILAMVLKMAEGSFRPMLLKIFEWATNQGADRHRVLTFYRLADCLAGKLRGLFLLFAAHIIKHAAQLLDLLNTSATEEPYLKKDRKGRKTSKLLNGLIGCVQKVCLYDTQNFINKDRFTMLMQPLLDQIENLVGGDKLYRQRITEYVVPAIADFAAATRNDSLWKTLNYQLMLKTRHTNMEVRLSALHALKEMHKKLGEDYLNLLPETIPFLSELMEDDCEEVENLTQEVIAEMEKTFGEPLQSYFN